MTEGKPRWIVRCEFKKVEQEVPFPTAIGLPAKAKECKACSRNMGGVCGCTAFSIKKVVNCE